MDQQRAQVRIAAFTHPEQRWLTATGALAWNQAQPGGDLPAVVKAVRICDRCDQCARSQWADARDLLELTAERAVAVPSEAVSARNLDQPAPCRSGSDAENTTASRMAEEARILPRYLAAVGRRAWDFGPITNSPVLPKPRLWSNFDASERGSRAG
jgi:hypothetical protein